MQKEKKEKDYKKKDKIDLGKLILYPEGGISVGFQCVYLIHEVTKEG